MGYQTKNPKSDNDTIVLKEKERTYGIDRLKLGDPAVKSENDSELPLAELREGQIANKKYRNNSIKGECNVLSSFKTLRNSQELKWS